MIELDTIYNEDCLTGMQRIPDGSVDCIICDLPYGTTANKWDSVIPMDKLWEQYKRVIKPKGAIVLFGAEPFSSMLRMSNPKWYKYDWIWEKEEGVGFQLAKVRPMMKTENISVFCKTSPNYYPIMEKLARAVRVKRAAGSNSNSDTSPLAHAEERVSVYSERYPVNILYFARDTDGFHPTQKPVDLLRYLVLTYTNEGDTILDNCMGSGTTAVACHREKRHFIGFELDKGYFDKAVKRIKLEQQQQTLF